METSFCLQCREKKDCKAICKPLQSYLNRIQAQDGYSDRHYRRKTRLDADIEKTANRRAMELKYGKKWVQTQLRKHAKMKWGE